MCDEWTARLGLARSSDGLRWKGWRRRLGVVIVLARAARDIWHVIRRRRDELISGDAMNETRPADDPGVAFIRHACVHAGRRLRRRHWCNDPAAPRDSIAVDISYWIASELAMNGRCLDVRSPSAYPLDKWACRLDAPPSQLTRYNEPWRPICPQQW